MRRTLSTSIVLLGLVCPAFPAVANAQERQIEESAVPRDLADRLIGIANDPASQRFASGLDLPAGSTINGNVVVMGPVRLDGRIDGELVVVGGNVVLGSDAEVTGNVTVVGGTVSGLEEASVGGTLMAFDDPLSLVPESVAEIVSTDVRGVPNGVRRNFGSGYTRFTFDIPGFNRIEGLPIHIGPSFSTGGTDPLRVQGVMILRTEGGIPFQNDRVGFDVQGEQFFLGRRAYRIGGGVFSRIDPLESWGLTDTENSWSAFLFTRDQRDYLERWGWRAFLRLTPRSLPFDLTVEYRDEQFGSVAPNDPWTVLKNDRPWRGQPLVAEGGLQSVVSTLRIDTRDTDEEPGNGWLIEASWLEGIGGDLAIPATTPTPLVAGPELTSTFSSGFLDVRRYHTVGGGAHLNFRGVFGGSPDGGILPPQFQHTLGGVNSLPGQRGFAADCAARTTVATFQEGTVSRAMFPFYGCDRFALFQTELRGGMGSMFGWERSGRDSSPRWIVFFDAGKAWSGGDWGGVSRLDSPILYDAGLGFMIGDLGIYWAHPFGEVGDGATVTLRLDRRF